MIGRRTGMLAASIAAGVCAAIGCGSSDSAGVAGIDAGSSPNGGDGSFADGSDDAGPQMVDSGHVGSQDAGGPADAAHDGDGAPDGEASAPLKTVFVILMANRDWAAIKGSASAPYIQSLLASAAHAEQYLAPAGNRTGEPNDIWLEAGGNLGIVDDLDPLTNHQATKQHLVTLLSDAGVSWKAYAENISGQTCPLLATGNFVPEHTPMVFFDDVTGGNDSASPTCIAHVRPYGELEADLSTNRVARYNFISPSLCDDMAAGVGCGAANVDPIRAGDTWLSSEVPKIVASQAYKDGGALFILWDQGTVTAGRTSDDGPLGLIVLSPKGKPGYASTTTLSHSATLKTIEEIFGVAPLLGAAATSGDLAEMFTSFP